MVFNCVEVIWLGKLATSPKIGTLKNLRACCVMKEKCPMHILTAHLKGDFPVGWVQYECVCTLQRCGYMSRRRTALGDGNAHPIGPH